MADSARKDGAEFDTVAASREAGVTEALELYMRAEEVYVKASASLTNPQTTRTSNSTNSG